MDTINKGQSISKNGPIIIKGGYTKKKAPIIKNAGYQNNSSNDNSNAIVKSKRRTKYQIEQLIIVIKKLQQEGKSNKEISQLLGVSRRVVENCVNKIYELDKENMKLIINDSAQNRLLTLYRKYDKAANMCESIMDDEHRSPKDRMDAAKGMISCHDSIYRMLSVGPLKLHVIRAKDISDTDFVISDSSDK